MRERNRRTHERRVAAPERRAVAARATLDDALETCRRELEDHLAIGDSVEMFRDSVSSYASLAHREGVPPERALALYKDMVARLPLVERSNAHERAEMMRTLSQMAIDSYYDARDD